MPQLSDPLTVDEYHALLWVVRAVTLDALREGPYAAAKHSFGHGPLSSATNKIEWQLGQLLRPEAAAKEQS